MAKGTQRKNEAVEPAEAFDYELKKGSPGNAFLLWTPCAGGGIIGVGRTRRDAVMDAILCLRLTAEKLEVVELPKYKQTGAVKRGRPGRVA